MLHLVGGTYSAACWIWPHCRMFLNILCVVSLIALYGAAAWELKGNWMFCCRAFLNFPLFWVYVAAVSSFSKAWVCVSSLPPWKFIAHNPLQTATVNWWQLPDSVVNQIGERVLPLGSTERQLPSSILLRIWHPLPKDLQMLKEVSIHVF